MSQSPSRRRRLPRKTLAVASAGTVLAIGGVTTLAAWNDTEWVIGALAGDGGPGIGTSQFEVQQNRRQPITNATSWEQGWGDHETLADAGALEFTPGALALTPGDTVYAPVALRTTAESDPATVLLQMPVPGPVAVEDANDELWNAMTYSVRWSEAPGDCTADTWSGYGADLVEGKSFTEELFSDDSAISQYLPGNAEGTVYYCFRLDLPAEPAVDDVDTLQGRTIAPAWAFQAESTVD